MQEHNRLPVEEPQVILPENSVDTACSPMLPGAFVDFIVEKSVERLANRFSHIPATSDVPSSHCQCCTESSIIGYY